jgi:hypothetical protein
MPLDNKKTSEEENNTLPKDLFIVGMVAPEQLRKGFCKVLLPGGVVSKETAKKLEMDNDLGGIITNSSLLYGGPDGKEEIVPLEKLKGMGWPIKSEPIELFFSDLDRWRVERKKKNSESEEKDVGILTKFNHYLSDIEDLKREKRRRRKKNKANQQRWGADNDKFLKNKYKNKGGKSYKKQKR